MICFKRNIIFVLMVIVNCMPLNRVMAPNNEGFKECYRQMLNGFLLINKTDWVAPDSPLICVRRGIEFLSVNDNLGSDLRDYFNQFPGQVNGDKILDRITFCAEINTEIVDPEAKSQPGMYFIERVKPPKTHITHSMYMYKLYGAGRSKDIDKEFEKCVWDLDVFGYPIASKDKILDLALQKYRISSVNNKAPYAFPEGTFKYEYLVHISEVVTLKDNSNLVTPWDYCSNRHPDKEQENANPENEVSTSDPHNRLIML